MKNKSHINLKIEMKHKNFALKNNISFSGRMRGVGWNTGVQLSAVIGNAEMTDVRNDEFRIVQVALNQVSCYYGFPQKSLCSFRISDSLELYTFHLLKIAHISTCCLYILNRRAFLDFSRPVACWQRKLSFTFAW